MQGCVTWQKDPGTADIGKIKQVQGEKWKAINQPYGKVSLGTDGKESPGKKTMFGGIRDWEMLKSTYKGNWRKIWFVCEVENY